MHGSFMFVNFWRLPPLWMLGSTVLIRPVIEALSLEALRPDETGTLAAGGVQSIARGHNKYRTFMRGPGRPPLQDLKCTEYG